MRTQSPLLNQQSTTNQESKIGKSEMKRLGPYHPCKEFLELRQDPRLFGIVIMRPSFSRMMRLLRAATDSRAECSAGCRRPGRVQ